MCLRAPWAVLWEADGAALGPGEAERGSGEPGAGAVVLAQPGGQVVAVAQLAERDAELEQARMVDGHGWWMGSRVRGPCAFVRPTPSTGVVRGHDVLELLEVDRLVAGAEVAGDVDKDTASLDAVLRHVLQAEVAGTAEAAAAIPFGVLPRSDEVGVRR